MRYAKLIIAIGIIICAFKSKAQNTQTIEPKGEYAQIHTDNDIRILRVLVDSTIDRNQRQKLADSIKQSPNIYMPPDLYALSYYLFNTERQNEAMFWFYLAQLRARYDVNRCADKTASAVNYNDTFGPPINQYAFAHLDTLRQVIRRVVAFEKINNEAYDQRWINLTGIGAISSGLDEKNSRKNNQLSLPQNQWPAIRTKTINDYWTGFEEYLSNKKDK